MKRVLAAVIALALVLALVPTTFALHAPLYEYVFDCYAMGLSVKTNLDTTKFTFDKSVSTITDPWTYYGRKVGTTYAAYTDSVRWAWKIDSTDAPVEGSLLYAFGIRVDTAGTYKPTLEHKLSTRGIMADIYIAPVPENTSSAAAIYEALDSSDCVGNIDFYGEPGTTTSGLSEVTLAAGDYVLLFVPNGKNENCTPTGSSPNYVFGFEFSKLTLDGGTPSGAEIKLDKASAEVDASANASVRAYTTKGNTLAPSNYTVEYGSTNTDVATINASTGAITAVAVGTTYITATVMYGATPLATEQVAFNVTSGNPNSEITTAERDVIITAANTNGTGVAVDIATNLTSYTQGNAQTNDVGTVVTATAPTEASGLKFRYWMNEATKRVVATNATVEFALGTNTKLTAVYAAEASGTLVEFFNANGEVISSTYYAPGATIAYPTLPTLTGYGTATGWSSDIANAPENNINIVAEYDEPSADIAIEVTNGTGDGTYAYNAPVTAEAAATSEGQVFSHWEKNGKLASYDAEYSFYAWGAATLTAVYADEAPTEIPSVFIDSVTKDSAVMAEFVGFAPNSIIEKGIFFGAGTPSITSYSEKATATGNGTQFTAKPNAAGLTARAYAIYRDGATVRVAYSD